MLARHRCFLTAAAFAFNRQQRAQKFERLGKVHIRFELRMRPVAAPHEAMHAKGRFRLMKYPVRIVVVGVALPTIPVRGRYLHPHTLRVGQLKQTAKAYVLYAEIRIGPAEVIDHDIHAGVQKRLDDRRQPWRALIDKRALMFAGMLHADVDVALWRDVPAARAAEKRRRRSEHRGSIRSAISEATLCRS